MKDPIERFNSKVNKNSGVYGINGKYPTECWEWIGAIDTRGYGTFRYNGKTRRAHRAIWQICKGLIKKNLNICHYCDNRKCIRLDHLYEASQSRNMKDAFSKNRKSTKGELGSKSKLKNKDVLEIRKLINEGFRQIDLAKKFNVQRSAINKIIKRITWKHI